MGEHLSGMAHERGEQFVFDRRKVNFLPRYEYLPPSEIDPQSIECKHRFTTSISDSGGMPQGGTHPGKEFIDTEWLGYIVIRTMVERRDFCLFLIAGRQYNDRRSGPFPHLANHFISVKIR